MLEIYPPTPDETGVRDHIHVIDLAAGDVAAYCANPNGYRG